MAGHSHAKNVRLRKAAVDAKRSRLFTKLAKIVTVAAREGGGDPSLNAKLAFAVNKAKSYSVPKDTIEKAIKKGTGELGGDQMEEILYEGYGPSGVAVICDILTDNRNRTAGEVRKIFDTNGGNLGSTNCVAYMFARKGRFYLEAADRSEETLMDLVLEAGADDLKRDEEFFEILCEPAAFGDVAGALTKAGIEPSDAELAWVAENSIDVTGDDAKKVARMLDALDDHDDVQSVFSNANIPEEAYADA